MKFDKSRINDRRSNRFLSSLRLDYLAICNLRGFFKPQNIKSYFMMTSASCFYTQYRSIAVLLAHSDFM